MAVGQLLNATAGFNTESGYDKLIVNGVAYDGTNGPIGESLSTAFTWSSDSSTTAAGWEVCAASIGAYFTVKGPCTVDGACVRSPNYPWNYGNSEDCTITP